MIKSSKCAVAVVAAFVSMAGFAKPASAQLGWTFVGVGEFDTDETYLAHAGISVSPRTEGWTWVAGVSASWLQFVVNETTDATRSVTAVTPSVGIRNSFGSGSASLRVGYRFTNEDDERVAFPTFTETGDGGVVTSGSLEYWGDGAWYAQGLASYGFGSESFWGRGRLAKRLFSVGGNGSISVGGEAAYMTADNDYDAQKYGGVVMFNPGRGTGLNFAVGQKVVEGENATYFTFELVLYPR